MAFVHEIQIQSKGFPGAPGFTNLYFASTIAADHDQQFHAARAFLEGIATGFPGAWSGQIMASGRLLEETTGALGSFTVAPNQDVAAKAGGVNEGFGAGVAGAVIAWGTATINRTRLVRGRTFLVPLTKSAYATDGTLDGGIRGQLDTAAAGLLAANVGFCVWSRPRVGTGGLIAPVLTHRINPNVAFLTSRRA